MKNSANLFLEKQGANYYDYAWKISPQQQGFSPVYQSALKSTAVSWSSLYPG